MDTKNNAAGVPEGWPTKEMIEAGQVAWASTYGPAIEEIIIAALSAAPQQPGTPKGWREFIEECTGTAGGMVNGNRLSSRAALLLAAAPTSQPAGEVLADEMLPCPFCGNAPELVDNGTGSSRVACLQSKGGCGAMGRMTFDKGVTAKAEWNRRAALATQPGAEVPSDAVTRESALAAIRHAAESREPGKTIRAAHMLVAAAQHSPKEVPSRDDVLEEAALAADKVQDDYSARQGGKWPELRDDAETGAGECAAAIRALKSASAPIQPTREE